jgi:hypothetical protein
MSSNMHVILQCVQAWAPFHGDFQIPAIAVDPDPAKRPDCIILRQTENSPANEDWAAMLGPQKQPRFTVPVNNVVRSPCLEVSVHITSCCCMLACAHHAMHGTQLQPVIAAPRCTEPVNAVQQRALPPWVILDAQATPGKQGTEQSLPPVPMELAPRAMADTHSYYFRKVKEDHETNTQLVWPAEEAAELQLKAQPSAAAFVTSRLPVLDAGLEYNPIELPPMAVKDMLKLQGPKCTVTIGSQQKLVTLLHVPTSHDGAVPPGHVPMNIEPKKPAPPRSLPLPPDIAAANQPRDNDAQQGAGKAQRTIDDLKELLGPDRDPVGLLIEKLHGEKPQFQFKKLEDAEVGAQFEITALLGGDVIGVGTGA